MTRDRIRGIIKNQERAYIPYDEEYEKVQMEIIAEMFDGISCTCRQAFAEMLSRLDELDMKMLPTEDLVRLSKVYVDKEIEDLTRQLRKRHIREYK